ncbi:MAG: hypothetical protein JWO98_96 [Frankiales bacterium]|nr:hypothetical protein [Frankiales bacterium]
MSDLPYTNADLRAEAVAQHQGLIDDPEYFTVGEAMCDAKVPSSVTGETWETLLDEDGYNTAQKKIHDLINGAANTSAWAVALGADGLEPSRDCFEVKGDDTPLIRMHFAFAAGMPTEARESFINHLGEVVANHL